MCFIFCLWFAPIKPLGILLTTIAKVFEVHTDIFKMLLVRRRPRPFDDTDMRRSQVGFLFCAVFATVGWYFGLFLLTYNDELHSWWPMGQIVQGAVFLWFFLTFGLSIVGNEVSHYLSPGKLEARLEAEVAASGRRSAVAPAAAATVATAATSSGSTLRLGRSLGVSPEPPGGVPAPVLESEQRVSRFSGPQPEAAEPDEPDELDEAAGPGEVAGPGLAAKSIEATGFSEARGVANDAATSVATSAAAGVSTGNRDSKRTLAMAVGKVKSWPAHEGLHHDQINSSRIQIVIGKTTETE